MTDRIIFEKNEKYYLEDFSRQIYNTDAHIVPFDINTLDKYPYLTKSFDIKVNDLSELCYIVPDTTNVPIYGCIYEDGELEWNIPPRQVGLNSMIQQDIDIIENILIDKLHLSPNTIDIEFDESIEKYIKIY